MLRATPMARQARPSYEVGTIGNDMGKGHGRYPGHLVISDRFPRSAELRKNLAHLDRIPHHHGIRQSTETGGLVHNLVIIAGLKRPLIREKQASGELVASLPPIELELHTSSQLEGMDIAQDYVEFILSRETERLACFTPPSRRRLATPMLCLCCLSRDFPS